MNIRIGYKLFKKTLLSLVLFSFLFQSYGFTQDLMEQAFETARTYQTIIDVGSTKNAVGNQILRESQTVGVNENFGQGCFIDGQYTSYDENECTIRGGDWNVTILDVNKREPLIVRVTKFLLRITMVLAITMVIINAVMYMSDILGGKDYTSTEAKKNLIFIAGGIVLALSSVAFINLVGSVTKSSLRTTDDLGDVTIGCNTGGVIIAGEDLKEWICENSVISGITGSRNANRIGNRCNRDGEWKAITTTEMRDKCREDLGGEVIN